MTLGRGTMRVEEHGSLKAPDKNSHDMAGASAQNVPL